MKGIHVMPVWRYHILMYAYMYVCYFKMQQVYKYTLANVCVFVAQLKPLLAPNPSIVPVMQTWSLRAYVTVLHPRRALFNTSKITATKVTLYSVQKHDLIDKAIKVLLGRQCPTVLVQFYSVSLELQIR